MFENPRRGKQARNLTTNVPKILDLKSSPEQIFSEIWRWVSLTIRYEKNVKQITWLTQRIKNTEISMFFW